MSAPWQWALDGPTPAVRFAVALLGAFAAVRWLRSGPYQVERRRELEAVRLSPFGLQLISAMFAGLAAGVFGVMGWALGSRDLAVGGAALSLLWLPQLLPRRLEASFASVYRARRDRCSLFFLRRLRLLVSGGVGLRQASQLAAQEETDPAFGPVAASVHEAIAQMADPLQAIAKHLAGGPAEVLLGTAISADQSGGQAGGHLDDLLRRTASALEGERRIGIEKMGGFAKTVSTMTTLLVTAPMMMSVLSTLNI